MNSNMEYESSESQVISPKRLVLFTNTYPFGTGETFLHNEIPFLAQRFNEIIIYPLYIPSSADLSGKRPIPQQQNRKNTATIRNVPDNVRIKAPLLPFDHKDKRSLLLSGFLNLAPAGFAIKEFFSRAVFLSPKKAWIFFNYLFIVRSILGNKKRMNEILTDLAGKPAGRPSPDYTDPTIAYFYWGDKSALLTPFLKKKLNKRHGKKYLQTKTGQNTAAGTPPFVVRFHGSDVYEQAKGYLPFRKFLYKNIDYAVPISQNGADYIRSNYQKSQPRHITVHRLGSYNPTLESPPAKDKIFRILSCSNVIALKRLPLIAEALKELGKELNLILELTERNINAIQWTHIGDGPILEELRAQCKGFSPFIQTNFTGRMPHEEVMEFYRKNRMDLFIQVSRSEGVPVSIMEAISFGAPVIATDVGGVNEIINEHTGTLLPKDLSARQLKETIIKYLNMPDEERNILRITAQDEWKEHWNAEKNYTDFAAFLYAIAGTGRLSFFKN